MSAYEDVCIWKYVRAFVYLCVFVYQPVYNCVCGTSVHEFVFQYVFVYTCLDVSLP